MMAEFLTTLQKLLQNLPAFVLWLVTVVFASAVVSFFLNLRIPRRYYVAVIGSRGSGKTMLIHALFREILEGRIRKVEATLSTRSTTERVMKGIALLDEGKPLGPTKDQDMFAYRTKIVLGSLLNKIYDVEFGDFPGHMSEELADDAVEPFLDPQFARWVNEADAFIFVVDVAPCFMGCESNPRISREYVVRMTAAIRTAWQNVLNEHTAGAKRLKSYPVALTFTKSDLVNYVSDAPDANVAELMQRWGFEELPVNVRIDTEKLSHQQKNITDAFSGVRTFFRQTNHRFREVFVSSVGVLDEKQFLKDEDVLNEPRLGLEELLRAVLPTPPS